MTAHRTLSIRCAPRGLYGSLQHPETYNQELAHCRYYDLFGLEAARFLEGATRAATAGLKRIADSAGI
jgi:hypothetical protein